MASTPYLDLFGLKALALLPAETLDEIDAANPGWFDATLAERSRWIDGRLSKRYACPFATPVPEIVQGWLARIVMFRATFLRGFKPTDESALQLKADHDAALEEIKEAANAVDGLFDLPLRQDTTASGISKGGPLAYSERSPYVGRDVRGRAGRDDDARGSGS